MTKCGYVRVSTRDQHPEAQRDRLIAALEHGSAFLVNRTAGALKDHPLTLTLASPMAADLVRYAKATVPGALARLGVDDVALTKLGLVQPETLEALKEVHSAASIGGEVAGTVGGAGQVHSCAVADE